METIIGIDLGTTNSVVSIVENGTPRVITDPDSGESVLPSVVGTDPSGNLLVGRSAFNQAALFPDATIRSVKRKMGEDVRLQLGARQLSPPEVSAMILGRLRQWAEQDLGRSVTQAVIAVPAYFDDGQREATRLAGELAGLQVRRIINEPTAAALVYEPHSDDPQRILVYDLGGGTFDVSIVAIESGVVEVLATFGDTQLGGDDFDALLADKLVDAMGGLKASIRKNVGAMARLSMTAETAKCRLSCDTFTHVAEEFLILGDPASHLEVTLDRSDYEASIESLLDRTIRCVDSALNHAGMHAGQLDKVVLVGGSTRTPLVEHLLRTRLGHQPASEVDPDLCVALGAAVQGALLAGHDVQRVLVDITPHTLGIRCADSNQPYGPANVFAPIIRRGSVLPCRKSDTFYTVTDGQPSVDVEVYQGESEIATDNQLVGTVQLRGLHATTPANSPVSVTFTLNLNGMLEVCAVDRRTGKQATATINRNQNPISGQSSGRVSEPISSEEISRMLGRQDDARTNPFSAQNQDRLSPGEGVTAGNSEMVERLNVMQESIRRTKDSASGRDKVEIEALVAELHDAIDQNNVEAFDSAADSLDDLLFYLNDA
jgi:molecular chaperone DnaK